MKKHQQKKQKKYDTFRDVSVHCKCPGFHNGAPVDLQQPYGRIRLGTLQVTQGALEVVPDAWEDMPGVAAMSAAWDRVLADERDARTGGEKAADWIWAHRWLLTSCAFLFTWLLIAIDA